MNTTVSSGTGDDATSTSVKQGTADITNTAKQGTITNEAKNLVNKAEEKLSNSAAEIENTATTSIKDTVGKSTVTTTTDGTTFENTDHNGAIGEGSIKKTTISGNTLETGKATMDYAEVMKDLRVGGTTTTKDLHVTNNATIDGTLGVTGAANFQDTVTVAKDLSVGGNATVAGDVTAKSYKVGDKTHIDETALTPTTRRSPTWHRENFRPTAWMRSMDHSSMKPIPEFPDWKPVWAPWKPEWINWTTRLIR